jgi:VanZ family protein
VAHIPVRRLLAVAMTLAWVVQIFWLSSESFSSVHSRSMLLGLLNGLHVGVSAKALDTLNLALRKLAHVVEYGILSILLYLTFLSCIRFRWQAHLAYRCILGAAAYAILDEFHQLFVPQRGASVIDVLIDVTGAVCGMLVVYLCSKVFVEPRSSETRTLMPFVG